MSMLRVLAVGLLGLAISVSIGSQALLAEGEGANHDAHAEHDAGAGGHAADGHAGGGHGDAHGGHGDPSPLTVDFDLAIFTVLIFGILLAVLWKFAWGPISAALDLREKKISDNITAAENLNQEARKLLGEYEAKLNAAREEVRGILDEARRDAEHAGQEIVAKARADAQAETQRGKHEIETATAQALKELAQTSANLAVDLAGKIVGAKLSAGDHAKLIEESLASFPRGDHRQN
jgi:F-type H+-transporting ATPase subunit b